MSHKQISLPALTVALALAAMIGTPSQASGACQRSDLTNPDRVVYRCDNGLLIEAETLAELETILPGAAAAPEVVSIENRAILIDLKTGGGPFQIRTPHAIASVRGTTYVIDATQENTSVFVVEGNVDVQRLVGSDSVSLSAGDGVVVSEASEMVVKQWPQEKVSTLLGRFGR